MKKGLKINQYYRYNSDQYWMMSDLLFGFKCVRDMKTFYL